MSKIGGMDMDEVRLIIGEVLNAYSYFALGTSLVLTAVILVLYRIEQKHRHSKGHP